MATRNDPGSRLINEAVLGAHVISENQRVPKEASGLGERCDSFLMASG
jgi:hypothetical protein